MWLRVVTALSAWLTVVALGPSAESVGYRHPSAELSLMSANRAENIGLIVKKIEDNLTLSCTLVHGNNVTLNVEDVRLDWSFPRQDTNRSRIIRTEGNTSHLIVENLQPGDAGQYTCFVANGDGLIAHALVAVKPSIPPYDPTPFCGAMMFSCGDDIFNKSGARCVPYSFLCDGHSDCPYPGKDESFETCGTNDPCLDKLRCNDGRCISKSWCCNGRKECVPHPCCSPFDEFPVVKTGGELRRNPNDQYIVQATLYKACAFFLLFLVAVSIFVSAVCRVRLKRIANGQVLDFNMGISTPEAPERQIANFSTTSSIPRDCRYSLVRYADPDTNFEVLNPMTAFPPSYSEYMAQTGRRLERSTRSNIPSSPISGRTSHTVDDSGNENALDLDGDEVGSVQNSPARRPNDFGMGLIANAIFNSRYRPVPQQNLEIASLDYPTTDSDSSCRSPATRIPNDSLDSGTVEFNSHFYGERIGGSPDINILRGLPDNRRSRHINALDRILDRFGLNAPYNVDIGRQTCTSWECQSFLSPTENDERTRERRRVFSTIWTRFKDRFRSHQAERPRRENRLIGSSNRALGNNNTNNGRRRRPDTPDVAEITLDNHQRHALTYFLSEDRHIDLCGEINYQRGLMFSRDLRLMPAHSFPPPYSQFAPDPPPPYMSRENLVASGTELNAVNNNLISDQNGNTVNTESSTLNNNVEENVESTNDPSSNDNTSVSQFIVAFETCDGNGNLEQFSTNVTQSQDSNEVLDYLKSMNEKDEDTLHFKDKNVSIIDMPSTSMTNTDVEVNDIICHPSSSNEDNDNGNSISYNSDKKLISNNMPLVQRSKEEVNGNCEVLQTASSEYVMVSDQNNSSVHNKEHLQTSFDSRALETSKLTDDCGLAFPPNNIEFIDSDIGDDRNRIEI